MTSKPGTPAGKSPSPSDLTTTPAADPVTRSRYTRDLDRLHANAPHARPGCIQQRQTAPHLAPGPPEIKPRGRAELPIRTTADGRSRTKISAPIGGSGRVLPGQSPSLAVTDPPGPGLGRRGTTRGTSTSRIPVQCVRSVRLRVASVQVERSWRPSGPLLIRGFRPHALNAMAPPVVSDRADRQRSLVQLRPKAQTIGNW